MVDNDVSLSPDYVTAFDGAFDPQIGGVSADAAKGWQQAVQDAGIDQDGGKAATAQPAAGAATAGTEHHWYDRPLGVLQAVGGVGEAAIGGALLATPEPTMLSKVAGVAVGLHGIDDIQAGLRTAWTGQPTPTVTQRAVTGGAQALGASPGAAIAIGAVVDGGLGMANPEGEAGKVVRGAVELSEAERAAQGSNTVARGTEGAAEVAKSLPAVRQFAGRLTGSLEGLTAAEKDVAHELLGRGRDVEVVPTGPGRTPDFRVNGTPTELKTLSGVGKQTSDGLSSALSSRIMDARGQARTVIVDARKQPGMTKEIAERGIKRAYGSDNDKGAKLSSITVMTPNGEISIERQ